MLNEIWQWLLGSGNGKFSGGDSAELGFASDYNGEIILGIALVYIALAFLVIRSYRKEGDASKTTKGVLAGIRILVITIIFVVLFRPVLILRFTNTLYSSVVVLIDDSMSMSFTDKYHIPSQREDENPADYQKRVDEAAAQRKALADELGVAVDELKSISRKDIVRRILTGRGGPLAELAKDHPLVLIRFSTDDQEAYIEKLMESHVIENNAGSKLSNSAEITFDASVIEKAMKTLLPSVRSTTAPAGDGNNAELLAKFDALPVGDGDARMAILIKLTGGVEKLLLALEIHRSDAEIATLHDNLKMLHAGGTLAHRMSLADLDAKGFATNFTKAISRTLNKVSGKRLAGIVVISDGQITSLGDGNGRLSAALGLAKDSKVPLYGISVGDPEPPRNLAVAALQAPREIRKDSEAEFTVSVTHRNLDGENVVVRLQEKPSGSGQWVDTGVTKSLTLNGGPNSEKGSRSLQTVTMIHTPTKLGDFVYRGIVEPVAGEEKVSDNKSSPSIVTVSENRIRILVISGDAGWELQYIRNFLVRQPDLYRLSMWQQNADPDVNQAASSGMKLTKLPRTLQELIGVPGDKTKPGYNVVILYDPQHTKDGFDGQFVKILSKFVKEHNGGLCYIAGNKHSDETLVGKGVLKPLLDLMPVVLAPNTVNIAMRIRENRPAAWPIRPNTYGIEHPITRLGGSDDDTKRIWELLPGQYWAHPVFKVKPGARILAESSNPMNRMANGKPLPLLVTQTVGAGRSLYVGMDATWRWRYVHDGYYHRRFWARSLRYLASMRTRRIVISTGGSQFSAGENITIEVTAFDKEYKPLTAEKFVVEMIDTATGKSKVIELPAVNAKTKPGKYKRTILARETGSFEVTALRSGGDSPDDVTSKKIFVELPKAEARRREANPKTLQRIASGPDYFMGIHEASSLAKRIPSGREKITRMDPSNLWDCPLTLIIIVLLLGAEWIIRKKYNMA
ncbi:MAG: VWA domain-containing protein [bacterium]|nr:VWA domain-containing protein [bacterium]